MTEGEIARFKIPSDLACGQPGIGDPIFMSPDDDMTCELQLMRIIPTLSERYKSIKPDEDVREQIVNKMQEDPKAYMKPSEKVKEVKFFDPKVHKLDPRQMIRGEGREHMWEETVTQLDIMIPIPQGTSKQDLTVRIK